MEEELKRDDGPSMAPLPIDIISNILARLPIKHILRLKTVCKSWLSLIKSSNFINLHLHLNSLSSSSNKTLIFSAKNHSLYSVNFDSPLESPAIKISFFNELSIFNFAGSCNGLLLCRIKSPNSGIICLVNPSMLQFRMIPNLQVPRNDLYVNYGFGFDFRVDDYKVVRIVNFICGGEYNNGPVFNSRQVMVYSLRNDSWKFIEEKISNYAALASRNGALVNNHLLHWMFWCISMNEHRISSFDVCSEQWSEVPLPNFYMESGSINSEKYMKLLIDLGILDGCLCLLIRNFWSHLGGVDVWVMKEYGIKKSWVKLFSVSDLDVTQPLQVTPVARCSKNAYEILLRTDEESRVFWYNISEKRATSVEIHGLPEYCGVTTCIQSLVSLGYGRTDDENQQRLR